MDFLQTMLPGGAAGSMTGQQTLDPFTVLAVMVPLALFLLVIHWALKRKERKKRAIELSYDLIALELLLFLLLPVCGAPTSCVLWMFVPLAMITVLLAFMYHRKSREAQHKRRIGKALSEGHIDKSGLLQGKIEKELKGRPAKEKEGKPEEPEEPEGPEEQKKEKKPEKDEEAEHKRIERMIERAVKKNKKS